MHDIKAIRDNPQAFDAALKRRRLSDTDRVRFSSEEILKFDAERRTLIATVEQWKSTRNQISKEIGIAMREKDEVRVAALMEKVDRLKHDIISGGSNLIIEREVGLKNLLAEIPNLPLDEVPDGADEHGNVQHHIFGKKRDYAFTPKPHDDLGGALGDMDFEAAAKLSGARFVVLKRGLARLERAIGQFFLDVHTGEHGYTEVNPPLLVRDDAMFGTAQLPKFREDQFLARSPIGGNLLYDELDAETRESPEAIARYALAALAGRTIEEQGVLGWSNVAMPDFVKLREQLPVSTSWLIPTAEVPLTNLVRESILDEKELPLRFTALTPCFRAEAGAAGRDTRGMIRQHQFTKVELVSITTPETSKDEHERMLSCAEEVLRRLDLHYRVMTLCTGDMGFASQKTYDIEVWMPGQGEGGAYREISSCSVCGDFQARRMDARYRSSDGKPRFVHTLNGSGTAVGRALIAVMETYQQADGSIAVPDVLQPYMGGLKVIAKDM
ncbi:seryl-tRNA synthetase [Nitrobacter winogradskyi Nb-255]|uniref:Serine--tRNA ligase n=1 Tax=Nitrobacter winogradskyi (strain ATCC 25391 / DSM 10237 / CIP 104748 / NCIMB 11846 / Nb-255) TaxID=323098 RepID=Q3SRQ4_NITWN|nr:serine--tRNA ligase [Nitrobacter winogradskyi]ABA05037.1 seryl-tRNA synthetase [Nitrobacter winogradskyi Nb-255]